MIRPYVEKDPTKFCTVEEFDEGVSALSEFVALRAEAVSNQLEGDDTPVDTGTLDLTAMGTMGGGMGGGMPGNMPGKGGGGFSAMSISPGKDSDTESALISGVDQSGNSISRSCCFTGCCLFRYFLSETPVKGTGICETAGMWEEAENSYAFSCRESNNMI